MIGYFPKAYPDELLYSICGRCFDHMGYPSKQALVQDLFGTRSVLASIELPSHLDQLITSLPEGHKYTADQLIDYHTLLPFYGPFLPPARLNRILQDMHGVKGPTLHMRSGIMASRVSLPRWLRFCTFCVQDDIHEFGETYWHRVHQLPGVEVCPGHKVYLQNSKVLAHNGTTRYEFVSAQSALQQITLQEPVQLDPNHEILLSIAVDAQWLLHQHRLSQDLQLLYQRYSKLLADRDLATYSGRVFNKEFQQRFRLTYTPDILDLLCCNLDEQTHENWLLRLVRKPSNAQHPLHHLLVIHFLGHSVETFFKISTENAPFGEGPWPCLNPASHHFHENQIERCEIVCSQHVGGRPIATFSCSCGYSYTRTGPDSSPEDRFKFSKVKSFGHVWEEKLRLLWEDETASLRGIAKQLKVDPLTVKRHAMRLGLKFPRPVNTSLPLNEMQQLYPQNHQQMHNSGKKETYRKAWQFAVKTNPDAGTQEIRRKVPQVYIWLYRYDKVWLKASLPSRKTTKSHQFYLNWEERDYQLAQGIKEAVKQLKMLPGRPIRISIAAIGRTIGQSALLQQHLDKLPLAAKSLSESVETREMFAVRKVFWIADKCEQENIYPTKWQLVKLTGVERIASLPSVQEAIDTALQRLHNGPLHNI